MEESSKNLTFSWVCGYVLLEGREINLFMFQDLLGGGVGKYNIICREVRRPLKQAIKNPAKRYCSDILVLLPSRYLFPMRFFMRVIIHGAIKQITIFFPTF